MRNLKDIIFERLVLSKNKKTPDITLEEFVRWYHSDKNGNRLVDIDELDEQDILEALDYPRSWGDVPIIFDEAFEEYYKNKDKILENIDETHKGGYYYVSFVAGDLDLEVRCPWSFIDFLNKYEKD
jgi:hypothetical protein